MQVDPGNREHHVSTAAVKFPFGAAEVFLDSGMPQTPTLWSEPGTVGSHVIDFLIPLTNGARVSRQTSIFHSDPVDLKRIKEILKQLDTEPLFHLSMASKELFHSNFWYWLSTLDAPATWNLFVNGPPPDGLTFHRESQGIELSDGQKPKRPRCDLAAESNGITHLAIENKFKDIAKPTQLARLSSSFDRRTTRFVVVSLVPPETRLPEGWTARSHKELVK